MSDWIENYPIDAVLVDPAYRTVEPVEIVAPSGTGNVKVTWGITPSPIPQGWQCPVCRRVMAPGMPNCTKCP